MIEPEAASGQQGGSKEMNHVSPPGPRTTAPGAAPTSFGLMIVSLPPLRRSSPPSALVFAPCRSCAADTGVARIRFVNQPESGTSSIVFRFCARQPVLIVRGVPNVLYMRS